MSTKRKVENEDKSAKRKWLTLEQKLNIIKLHDDGASFAKISRDKGINESSIRLIIKNKDHYKSQGIATASYLSKSLVSKHRTSRMINMERLLGIWIEDLNQKRIPLSQMEIQAKALSIFKDLKDEDGGEINETFTASHGWFFRLKKRSGIHNVRIVGESASADKESSFKISFRIKKNC